MACPPWRCRRPRAPGWDPLNEAHPAARCLEWRSARLGNHRRVWIYTTGEVVDPQTRPLAILLDGQFWAESMPVWSPLAALTCEGRLPPAVYLLIDAIDNQRRGVELPCHRDFWLAVQEELLPLVHGYARSATARIGRWWPGKASAVWRRCSPLSTGRSALAACSASQAPTGGRTAMAAGRALSANSFARVRCPRPGCASGWKRANANRSFSREPGATGATHHNTADDFLASG
nr:Ferric enterobactin esterase [Klebsiella pneumoniae]